MLLVKTVLAQSPIDGLGLFADQFIPAGTPVWRFDPRIDLVLDVNSVDGLSQASKEYFDKYAYLDIRLGKYVVCGDDARFVNHSAAPNLTEVYTIGQDHGIDVAGQDIMEGEELTCDYRSFDSHVGVKLNSPHIPL